MLENTLPTEPQPWALYCFLNIHILVFLFCFFKDSFYFITYNVSICVRVCACECGFQGGQNRALDPLELEFQAVVSLLKWVPGTKLGLTAKPFLQSLYYSCATSV